MARRRQCKRQHKKNEDIISDLNDSVLIHILSFLNAKQTVQTSILSKRWIFLWKSLPTLALNSFHFSTVRSLDHFVSQFLSLRNGSMAIHTLNFYNGYDIVFTWQSYCP
ncbi:F-box/LRR-repeat protein [Trifolium repens]|nr:F-box/LRR-repeat protein [Trifolium repens]